MLTKGIYLNSKNKPKEKLKNTLAWNLLLMKIMI